MLDTEREGGGGCFLAAGVVIDDSISECVRILSSLMDGYWEEGPPGF